MGLGDCGEGGGGFFGSLDKSLGVRQNASSMCKVSALHLFLTLSFVMGPFSSGQSNN